MKARNYITYVDLLISVDQVHLSGSVSKAAEILNISKNSVREHMRIYNLIERFHIEGADKYREAYAQYTLTRPKKGGVGGYNVRELQRFGLALSLFDSLRAPAEVDYSRSRYVITSAESGVDPNFMFLDLLESYCEQTNSQLIILPITKCEENLNHNEIGKWHPSLHKYLVFDDVPINNNLLVKAGIHVSPSFQNPIDNLEYSGEGKSLIVGHPKLQMRSVPVVGNKIPRMIHSTGTVTVPNYTMSRIGDRNKHLHSYSAVVVESDKNFFYFRQITQVPGQSYIYDLNYKYTKTGREECRVESINFGDTHVLFMDRGVLKATWANEDSIVNVLKPKVHIHNDYFDAYSISHHHTHDDFIMYGKSTSKSLSLEGELNNAVEFHNRYSVGDFMTIYIPSNHIDHLTKFLRSHPKDIGHHNMKIYYDLKAQVMSTVTVGQSGVSYQDPFTMYMSKNIKNPDSTVFLGRNQPCSIKGVEVNLHGDAGINGSRGSVLQYVKLGIPTISGHSHSMAINKTAWSAGTCTPLRMSYNSGPSTWMQGHVVIYPNGTRSQINIINGKWRV